MADRIKVQGIPAFDGEYDLDIGDQPLNALEWRWVKKISGYLPFTIDDGLSGGDPDVVIALAVVAMQRAGKITRDQVLMTADQLADLPFDDAHILLLAGDVEDPPPVSPPTSGQQESENGSSGSSGGDSTMTSENPEPNQPVTGLPVSATSAISTRGISTT